LLARIKFFELEKIIIHRENDLQLWMHNCLCSMVIGRKYRGCRKPEGMSIHNTLSVRLLVSSVAMPHNTENSFRFCTPVLHTLKIERGSYVIVSAVALVPCKLTSFFASAEMTNYVLTTVYTYDTIQSNL